MSVRGEKRPAPGGSSGGSAAVKARGSSTPTEPSKTAQIVSAWAHGFMHKRPQRASSKRLGAESYLSCPHYSLIAVRAATLCRHHGTPCVDFCVCDLCVRNSSTSSCAWQVRRATSPCLTWPSTFIAS